MPDKAMFYKRDFEETPIWAWDESLTGLIPMPGFITNVPDVHSDCFIKATITDSQGQVYDGYVIWDSVDVFAFGVFAGEHDLTFNLGIREIVEGNLNTLCRENDIDEIVFFPIQYETKVFNDCCNLIKGCFSHPDYDNYVFRAFDGKLSLP